MKIGQVVDRFGLGGAVVALVPVPGGLSYDLWRVETERGAFAVKRMVVNADRPEFVANVEAAFCVEARALAAGVPMPAPAPDPVTGRALVRVGDDLVRVHTWVAGVAGAGSAGEASVLLAGIHTASRVRWASRCGGWRASGWGDELPALAARVAGGPSRLLEVDSHRDLDRKNTLRRCPDGTLMAIDWDAAGAVPAVHDAVRIALDWAGTDPARFRAAIRDYQQVAAVEIPAEPWVFAGWVNALGGWLDDNADERAGTEVGDAEVAGTLGRLSQLAADLDVLVDALA